MDNILEGKTLTDGLITKSPINENKYFWSTEDAMGEVLFTFEEPVWLRNKIEVQVTVDLSYDNEIQETFDGRLDILSLSSRESFARSLKKVISSDISWDKLLAQSSSDLKRFLESKSNEIDLSLVEDSYSETWLLEPLLVKGGVNMIFGKGGTGKSFLTLALAKALKTGEEFLGLESTTQVNTLFLDYEDTPEEVAKRVKAINDGQKIEDFWYYPAKGIPLADLTKSLKKVIENRKIGLLIVDSAVLACGGRPEEAEQAGKYFNALASLGITSLTIAHETKQEGGKYPFGSVFFWNSPRNIWYIKGEQEQDDKLKTLGLFHRKSNRGQLKSPIGIRMWFENDNQVEIKRGALSQNWSNEFSVGKRVLFCLKDGPKTLEEMKGELLDVNEQVLKNTLNRYRKKGRIDNVGGVWITIASN